VCQLSPKAACEFSCVTLLILINGNQPDDLRLECRPLPLGGRSVGHVTQKAQFLERTEGVEGQRVEERSGPAVEAEVSRVYDDVE